jgi:hypothetical protein
MGDIANQLMESTTLQLDTFSDIGSLRQHLDIPVQYHSRDAGQAHALRRESTEHVSGGACIPRCACYKCTPHMHASLHEAKKTGIAGLTWHARLLTWHPFADVACRRR